MIRVKDKRRFRVFIIISVIVLVVLVWSMIWVNIAAGEQAKRQNTASHEQAVSTTANIDDKKTTEAKHEDPKDESKKTIPDNHNAKPTDKTKVSENETNKTDSSGSTKPVAQPEKISEDQLYSVYNNTLIIGDSRIEGFKLYSGVKNASYFCMKAMTIDKIVEGKQVTISGKATSVYDMLDSADYDKVIVGVGLNELGWNHIETFLEDYSKLIDKIKEKQPDAVIYLQAVLPVSKSKNDSDKVHNNAQVYWYNQNIIKLAEDKGVKFVNPAAALVDADGYLVAEATTDGVHLNSKYCKVWAEYLAGLIK